MAERDTLERYTPGARRVFELALREALSLGHNYIGTEHILLGLVREKEGLGARVLDALGADADKVRNEVVRQLTPSRPGPHRETAPRGEERIREIVREEIAAVLAEREQPLDG